MKIALIKQRFVGFGGGSERYYTGLVEGLRRGGHDVHIFAHHWDEQAEREHITLHRVNLSGRGTFLAQLTFALNCRRAVERERCDLVFSAERTLRQDICRAGGGCHREWLRQRARFVSPLKRAMTALNPLHLTLLWLERRMFSAENTRHIIANSHRGKAEIVRLYGYPDDRVTVIQNGVDCERFKPVPRTAPRKEFVLLSVGSGFERKGLRFCIEALGRLPAQVKLVVAGKGNPAPYQRLAASMGMAQRVEFLGATQNIRSVYAQGDVLLHPAIYEPFSNACLEALACGLPVVTTRINGASEVITPGVDGAVVDEPDDIGALAEGISLFLDPQRYAAASEAARRKAETLSFHQNVEQTIGVFDRLLKTIKACPPHTCP